MEKIITDAGIFIAKHRILYYILNYTWGIAETVIGFIVGLALLPFSHRKKYRFTHGKELNKITYNNWGFSIGTMFVTTNGVFEGLSFHEFGHCCQNAVLGPFKIILVSIPSLIRYWYRRVRKKIGRPCATNYDDAWFERSATRIGLYSL